VFKTKTIIIVLPAFITFVTNYPHHPGKRCNYAKHMLMPLLLWQLQRSKVSSQTIIIITEKLPFCKSTVLKLNSKL
jgi:hypothetical protein